MVGVIDKKTSKQSEEMMSRIELNIEKLTEDVVDIKKKIYNGFSASIKSTENKVNYIDERNTKEHDEIKERVKELSMKLDKLLWKLVGITFFAMLISHFAKYIGG